MVLHAISCVLLYVNFMLTSFPYLAMMHIIHSASSGRFKVSFIIITSDTTLMHLISLFAASFEIPDVTNWTLAGFDFSNITTNQCHLLASLTCYLLSESGGSTAQRWWPTIHVFMVQNELLSLLKEALLSFKWRCVSRPKGTLLCLTDEITGKIFGFTFWHLGHLEPRAFYYCFYHYLNQTWKEIHHS